MTNVIGLLDTNILIDISHKHAPAINWMQNNPNLVFAISSLVRMEMVLGARNKAELEKIVKLLKPYPVVFPSEVDGESAMNRFESYYLSHQIEIIDCFIAAMSVRLSLPIYSRNAKDLGVFKNVVLIVPY
jgi:predicted nucleic acid-binding protein